MPDGKLMIEKSVEGIDISVFTRVVVVCLKEHLKKYSSEDMVLDSFEKSCGVKPDLVVLDEPTSSQSDTIYQAIKQGDIEGPIFIKD
ncbi:hypothetical protein AB4424_24760, partial [Vibrio splendidus]